jgi:hypothetical protein
LRGSSAYEYFKSTLQALPTTGRSSGRSGRHEGRVLGAAQLPQTQPEDA